jgi:fermentation-respiration switch protein FrsA (DUF1100 family)
MTRGSVVLALLMASAAAPGATTVVTIRGRPQTLHLYGPPDGDPVVVASGDGGWVHLAPQVSELLGGRGYSVVGVDSKAYLSSFTAHDRTLSPSEVPADFRAFVDAARRGRDLRTLLVGVSEGGGLSVLAASDPGLQDALLGVLGLGLPEVNELGWRFRDSMTYLTKRTPDEPLFHASDYLARLGPIPLAAIHSRRDEYVPLETTERLLAGPGGPHRLWVIDAADHRFSDRPQELASKIDEAIAWIEAQPR